MLNQNLLKPLAMPIAKATPSTSFEDDFGYQDIIDKNFFDFIEPMYAFDIEPKEEETTIPQPKTRKRGQGESITPESYRSTKNVAKNYGKAIASFASSDLATPYIERITATEPCSPTEFLDFIRRNKEQIQGIDSFRAMLLPKETDDAKEAAFKRVFQRISEVFINFFSVNWICHGKMKDKVVYLKFRFKILRRIRNPELFTYLKKSKKKT